LIIFSYLISMWKQSTAFEYLDSETNIENESEVA